MHAMTVTPEIDSKSLQWTRVSRGSPSLFKSTIANVTDLKRVVNEIQSLHMYCFELSIHFIEKKNRKSISPLPEIPPLPKKLCDALPEAPKEGS